MTDESSRVENGIEPQKLKRMILRIAALERENSKTQKKKEKEMKEAIQAIIEEEAEKCY